ncbi:alpha-1,6-mannosyltransferase [Basidiobolus ranarum]|uniref:Alpha-1,6-mannosyltransferase n=1 Tax=Basidiobolus ranarum TaxID=34480 RepID=A0ABR2VYI8_9FUNG
MQKRYIGVLVTAFVCIILIITYVTLTPSGSPKVFDTLGLDTSALNTTIPVSTEKVRPEQIAIVMAYDNYSPVYVPKTVDNKKEYAKYHGYKIFVQEIEQSALHASWSKITYMKQVMEENPHIEWFWWIDLDSIIMEPTIPLEKQVLDPRKIVNYANKDVIISWDCNGMNTGSFFLRNRPWTHDFLNMMVEYSTYDPSYYGEQRVMQRVYRKDQTIVDHFSFPILRQFGAALEHKCDLDYGDWQSIHLYHPGDFLVHMTNCEHITDCEDKFHDLWEKRKMLPKANIDSEN